MTIANFYTSVSVEKTLQEIQQILIKHGASKVIFDYENKIPINVTFASEYKGALILFSLPCRFTGILKICKTEGTPINSEQARKIGWRTLKDWIKAQLSIVEQEMAELPEVFLQYGVTRNGERLYEYIKSLDSNSTPLMLSE